MRVSTRGRYGLRALVDLAIHATAGPVALREIAERQGVSESYLEQVFASLRKAGLVTALRGPQGGYELGRPAAEITAGDVLRVLEGPISPVHCVDQGARDSRCKRGSFCATRGFWEDLRDQVNAFLDGTSLADLANRAPGNSESKMYYI